MGYFSNLDIDEQEHNAHIQDQEPDQASYIDKDYVSKVFASAEFRQEFDEFLASIRGE
jgi:hypothetical protein